MRRRGGLDHGDPDRPLDGVLDFVHERGADCAGKGAAQEKGFIERGDLFTLGHRGFLQTTLPGRQFNMSGSWAKGGRKRDDDGIIREAIANIHGHDQGGPMLLIGGMSRPFNQVYLAAVWRQHGGGLFPVVFG